MRDELVLLAQRTLDACLARKLKIATAESCTGGLLAGALTENAGASNVFERGFVTYSNEAKQDMLGVPAQLIAAHGAVSAEVAEAMALGALAKSRAQLVLSVTGIAGPDGGTAEKPVGLVHFAVAQDERPVLLVRKHFVAPPGKVFSRVEIRRLAVLTGLHLLLEAAAPQLRA
ncbi:CinA family protein [Rhodoblastus sp.]|uniref:CinA family protein n=1 Tax=Rhodoblastus sp. TaxID=1962975 RepID=UPI003F9B041F